MPQQAVALGDLDDRTRALGAQAVLPVSYPLSISECTQVKVLRAWVHTLDSSVGLARDEAPNNGPCTGIAIRPSPRWLE